MASLADMLMSEAFEHGRPLNAFATAPDMAPITAVGDVGIAVVIAEDRADMDAVLLG